MTFRNYIPGIILKVLVQFAALGATALLIVKQLYIYELLVVPVIIYLVIDLYRRQTKMLKETSQFAASIKYRDFSRNFNTRTGPHEMRELWGNFNGVNDVLKEISKERETQHLYLQSILELVDTGILSYDMDSGDVMWMNESLKQLIGLPYMKTINGLSKRDNDLMEKIQELKPGSHVVTSLLHERSPLKVLLSATSFHSGGRKYKLVAFQNVNDAMDEAEAKAWQKLLSVMTHEIMNSIAPIASLSDTLKNRLDGHAAKDDPAALIEDLKLGIDTIKKRSNGLLRFTETYRGLNKITSLSLQSVYPRDLFENVYNLMEPTLEDKNIELDIHLKDPSIMIEGDPHLLEQVLINIVVNAIDAVKETEQPKIVLSAYLSTNEKVAIKVSDNGTGIEPELLEQVFVPFFTSKKNGSGIGLSLCKQIMMLHNGNIQVMSEVGKGSAFVLQF